MTLREFLPGWMLLTAQPWGTPYRKDTRHGTEPSPGDIQAEFYYQALKTIEGAHWMVVCQTLATSEKWPSIDTIKTSLRHCHPPSLTLSAPEIETVSMEEALADRPDLLATLQRMLRTERNPS